LFTFAGGSGHAEPLVPIANALEAAGHRVAYAGQHAAVAPLDTYGFTLFPRSGCRDRWPRGDHAAPRGRHGKEYRTLRTAYADRFARVAANRLLELSTKWQPDIVVCDGVDFGSMTAAERLRAAPSDGSPGTAADTGAGPGPPSLS
jgi:UDP:flavonoid glycosyltransferase YjiC (YdhE family)